MLHGQVPVALPFMGGDRVPLKKCLRELLAELFKVQPSIAEKVTVVAVC